MKETTKVVIITAIFLTLAIITKVYFPVGFGEDFNFYKSELTIDGNTITETLHYKTDKRYHTLYRKFENTISYQEELGNIANTINIQDVNCQVGRAYVRTYSSCYFPPSTLEERCLPYTEVNEYGCSFGNTYGFNKGVDYWISSTFEISPENLFLIGNQYYTKFVAYTPKEHTKLITEKNFIIRGNAIYNDKYNPKDNVVIYIPFDGDSQNYNIIRQEDFEFDNSTDFSFLINLLYFFPALLFILCYLIFGIDKHVDIPEQLSTYPKERKAWEVSAFFDPPFGTINNSLFSTLMLDFYRRKLIDIKTKKAFFGNDTYIKVLKPKEDLDKIEQRFYELLRTLEMECSEKNRDGKYFNFRKVASQFGVSMTIRKEMRELNKRVKKDSKNYLNKTGKTIFSVTMILAFLISFYTGVISLALYFLIVHLINGVLTITKGAILVRFKDNYYEEFLKWQAFRKWLSDSDSMKHSDVKGVIMWEKYLVYATALGVSKKVLKQLKKLGYISETRYNTYMSLNIASSSFATSTGANSGGFGGAGGGGVGGGGGGGR